MELGLPRGLTWLLQNAPANMKGVLTNHQVMGLVPCSMALRAPALHYLDVPAQTTTPWPSVASGWSLHWRCRAHPAPVFCIGEPSHPHHHTMDVFVCVPPPTLASVA